MKTGCLMNRLVILYFKKHLTPDNIGVEIKEMKKLVVVLSLILVACGPHKEVVSLIKGNQGEVGATGQDGVSCVSAQTETGASFTCSNGTVFVSNGADGINGVNGADGSNGLPGVSSGSMSEVALDGCTSIAGTGLWAKTQGGGSIKLYTNGSCSGSAYSSLSSTDEIQVLNDGSILLFQTQTSKLFLLELSGV